MTRLHIVFILLYNLCFCTTIIAQGDPPSVLPPVIPPSPNAASFAKYGNIPISPYTGVPKIDIPLYTISVRDIQVPVSLSYHASGIKVAEEASRVGLGWVLNCGGVITRNIINKDDFLVDPTGYLNPLNDAPELKSGPGYAHKLDLQVGTTIEYYNVSADPNAPTVQHTDLQSYVYGNYYDFQPDQFTYNFLGYSGKFVLTRNREAVIEKNEKIKIRPVTADGSSWEVVSADGFTYKFDVYEYFVDHNNTAGYQQKSAWYLTKVVSPQKEEVTFHYETLGEQYIKTIGSYSETVSPVILSCADMACTALPLPPAGVVPGKFYSNLYLSSVDWKFGTLRFNYADDRLDLAGDRRLASIDIIEKGTNSKRQEIVFNQDYFTSTPVGNTYSVDVPSLDYLYKRLKLQSVTKRSVPDVPTDREVYSFSYYDADEFLPAKNSFARDHWGYNNGKYSNQSFIPSYHYTATSSNYNDIIGVMGNEREPQGLSARAFTIKEIIYPTKGKTVFHYESNDFDLPEDGSGGQQQQSPCQIPTSLFYPASSKGSVFERTLDLTDQYIAQNGTTLQVELRAAFRVSGTCHNGLSNADVYFQLYTESGLPVSTVTPGLPPCEYEGQSGCIRCNNSVFEYRQSYTLTPGKYKWKAFINSNATQFEDISATYTWWAKAFRCNISGGDELKYYALAGGLRIAKIEDFVPENNETVNVRRFVYHHTTITSGGVKKIHSYGKRMVRPSYSYYDVAGELQSTVIGNVICNNCVHLVRTSDSNTPPFNSQGYSVGYSKVVEFFGETGNYGRIEYEYENREDEQRTYVLNNGVPIRPGVFSTRSYPLNGMLKKQTYLNSGLQRVKEIENSYNLKRGKTIYGLDKNQIRRINMPSGPSDVLLTVFPVLESNFVFLSESVETNYHNNTPALMIRTKYFYDNPEHLQLTKKTVEKSNEHISVTEYRYPADYSDSEASTVILAMKGDRYMHSYPIEVTTKNLAPNGNETLLHREFSVYDFFNTMILLKERFRLESRVPLTSTEVPHYIPAAPYDEQLFKKLISLNYNTEGNVAEIQKVSDVPISYLYGYNKGYPIAEIRNANEQQCFYSSFEDDGDLFANEAKTGKKVKNGSSFTFPSTYAPNENNTVMSYWYWQNNAWHFSGVVPFQRTIHSAGSKLDEVRAFPKRAQMKTYTYDPMVGVTSIADENNVCQYFEYDLLGRLKAIRDDRRNVVKRYRYHYKQ
jgi:hypothetical protein